MDNEVELTDVSILEKDGTFRKIGTMPVLCFDSDILKEKKNEQNEVICRFDRVRSFTVTKKG